MDRRQAKIGTVLPISINLVVFTIHQQQLSVLVKRRQHSPFKQNWELIQVQVELDRDDSLEEAVKRQLLKFNSFTLPFLEQVHTIGNRNRDPRGWSLSVVYYSLVYIRQEENVTFEGQEELKWVPLEKLLKIKLAFDHNQIVKNCLQRLQNKSLYTSLPIFLLSEEFTLTELQKAYEIILGFPIQKKSFRRRLLDAGFLTETGNSRRASHRPAQLYRLVRPQPYFFPRIIEGIRTHRDA